MRLIQRIRDLVAPMDQRTIEWVRHHVDLVMALATIGFVASALISGRWQFAVGVLGVGALSYFAGFTPAIVIALVAPFAELVYLRHVGAADVVVEMVGYLTIAWLGYRHKEQARSYPEGRKRGVEQTDVRTDLHSPHVLPWVVMNDVRTSLAAVRFLLFPLNDGSEDANVRRATEELSRLEGIFSKIEAEQQGNTRPDKRKRG